MADGGRDLGLLCVHAHPDDESISTGGVLARAVDEGIRARVVTCTGGELGEIVGPGMDADEIRPRLGEVRRAELAEALRILGAEGPHLLGYRDSGMAGTPGNEDADCFWQASMDEAVGRLVAQIREFRPSVVVTYDAWGGYGHPDHIQTHRVGLLASEASAVGALYPDAGAPWRVPKVYAATLPRSAIVRFSQELRARGLPSPWGEVERPEDLPFGTDDALVTAVVDVRPWLERKWSALRAHVSQLSADSFFLNVPEEARGAAFGTEWFTLLRSDLPVVPPETDLFAGLR